MFSSIKRKFDDLPSAGGAFGEALRSGVPVVGHDISSDRKEEISVIHGAERILVAANLKESP